MKRLKALLYLFAICSSAAQAQYMDEVGGGLGMAMVSFTENPTSLEGENISEPEGGGVTAMSANLYWKVLPLKQSSIYLGATVPLAMIGGGDTYFSLSCGFEYYFSEGAHKYRMNTGDLSVTVTPKMRYFAFAELGISYMSYTTETAKKNDTFFEAGGGGGMAYTINNNWSIRATAAVLMGAGVLTSPMTMKFFAAGTYFLNN